MKRKDRNHKTGKSASVTRRKRPSRATPAGRRSPSRLQAALADPRCPPVGSTMTRTVTTRAGKTVTCVCKVTDAGFEYEGELHDSPTPVATTFAREVMGQAPGSRRAGFQFFFPRSHVPEEKKTGARVARITSSKKAKKTRTHSNTAPATTTTTGAAAG
ncbi:MAG: hypothetical protein HY905_15730 [Deltaproteobacteria bacterium]|nr:hypothetical protein [Deltaproteobacteria bacterium]